MAVEDAAALAECLSHVTAKENLRSALSVWEKVRMSRTRRVQDLSLQGGNVLHLPDGAEQKARDAAMSPGPDGQTVNKNPWGLTDPKTRDWCYGYDAVEEVRKERDHPIRNR